jgi:hypothetical protein
MRRAFAGGEYLHTKSVKRVGSQTFNFWTIFSEHEDALDS